MAFFKFRKGGDETPAAPPQAESVEVVRRRARHRLIGAAVLVLIGVVGFPLLFDTQPRPVAADIPIDIPDRDKARPLPPPQPAARAEAPASQPAAGVQASRSATSPPPSRPVASGSVTAAAPEARPAAAEAPRPAASASKPQEASTPVAAAKPAAAPAPQAARPASAAKPAPAEAARAQALLEGRAAEVSTRQPASDNRFVVQVGAFADAGKARETRLKVERAGLKTYTQEADTKAGKRIRVRVGPFATRAEADKAAGRIKELDLPAAILTL